MFSLMFYTYWFLEKKMIKLMNIVWIKMIFVKLTYIPYSVIISN